MKSKNKRVWLEVAEYGSLVTALALIIYRQTVSFSFPFLAAFIWLNLKSRRFIEQANQKFTTSEVAQVTQQFQSRMKSIDAVVQTLPHNLDLQEVIATQGQIQITVAEVQQYLTDSLESSRIQLQNEIEKLTGSTATEVSGVRDHFKQAVESLDQRLQTGVSELTSSFDVLQQQLKQLEDYFLPLQSIPQEVKAYQGELEKTAQSIVHLENRFAELPSPPEPVDLGEINSAIAQNEAKLIELTSKLALVPTYLKQLQKNFTEEVTASCAQFQAQIAQLPNAQTQIEAMQLEVERLQAHIDQTVHEMQENFVRGLESLSKYLQGELDRQEQGAAIVSLNEQLATISQVIEIQKQQQQVTQQKISDFQQQIEQLPPASIPFDPSSLFQKINALEVQASALQQYLLSEQPFEHLSLKASINSLEEKTTSLQQQVSESAGKSMATDLLEEVTSEIAILKQQSQKYLTQRELDLFQQKQMIVLEEQVTTSNKQFDNLMSKVEAQMEKKFEIRLNNLDQGINQIKQQFEGLNELEEWVENLDSSYEDLQDRTRNVEKLQNRIQILESQYKDLYGRIQDFNEIKQQLEDLADDKVNLKSLRETVYNLSQQMSDQIDEAVDQRVYNLNKLLKEAQPKYVYQLIHGRSESRRKLMEAMDKAQQRLILVCPWVCRASIDDVLRRKIESALKRYVSIEIGYGHLRDLEDLAPSRIKIRQTLREKSGLYNALDYLEGLESSSCQFKLKFLGTHEKYLICDRQFAMLGSHNFLTSGNTKKEREIGLYTTDPHLIEQLIHQFETAENLDTSSPLVASKSLAQAAVLNWDDVPF